jgi:hypothetical protein
MSHSGMICKECGGEIEFAIETDVVLIEPCVNCMEQRFESGCSYAYSAGIDNNYAKLNGFDESELDDWAD